MPQSPADTDFLPREINGKGFFEIHSDALIPRTSAKSILIAAGVAVAVIAAVVLGSVVAGMVGASAAALRFLPGITIFVIFAGYFIWRRLWQRNFETALEAIAENPTALTSAGVEKMRELGLQFTVAGIRVLGQQLLKRGWLGYSFRIAPRADQPTPAPLEVAIEPMALDESSEPFLQLSSSGSVSAATAAAKSLEQSESTRRFRRSFAVIWLSVVIFILLSIPHFIRFIRSGQASFSLLMYAFLIGVMFLQASVGLDHKRNRLLAVNGGLLFRKFNWLGGGGVHLFNRDNSVLFVFRAQKKQWWWAVFGPGYEKGAWMFGTAAEAEMLIRAWLSPLPPPEPDRLSDFR